MTGDETNASGICIKSTVMYTIAQSPAYVLNGMIFFFQTSYIFICYVDI